MCHRWSSHNCEIAQVWQQVQLWWEGARYLVEAEVQELYGCQIGDGRTECSSYVQLLCTRVPVSPAVLGGESCMEIQGVDIRG